MTDHTLNTHPKTEKGTKMKITKTDKIRQGRRVKHMPWILGASLAGAILAVTLTGMAVAMTA